ncbi:hypothetical protein QW131_17885 [Roseibium salinum]|nr:hypothetical protein [Roseibium salinum]
MLFFFMQFILLISVKGGMPPHAKLKRSSWEVATRRGGVGLPYRAVFARRDFQRLTAERQTAFHRQGQDRSAAVKVRLVDRIGSAVGMHVRTLRRFGTRGGMNMHIVGMCIYAAGQHKHENRKICQQSDNTNHKQTLLHISRRINRTL